MTTAASQFPLIGSQPIGNFFTPDNVQRHVRGAIVDYVDPYWGGGQAIYLAIPAGVAFRVGEVVTYGTDQYQAVDAPNTANLAYSVAFAMNANVANASQVQYGWFVISGEAIVLSTASVAAGTAIGIAAAGKAGTNSAGKQIQNAMVSRPATSTVVKSNVQTVNGSPILRFTVGGTDGLFVGGAVTGTGIPASTTITAINPDNTVVMSANATATGSVTVTETFNDGTNFYNVVTVNGPSMQGAIT